jgi:GNAT superfamily N-acetyltransferase
MKITTKVLTPGMWPMVEKLFGATGACGGCWCMYWRIKNDEKWDDIKGKTAKTRLKKQIVAGSLHAILAFDGDDPVGWCTFGPRLDFPRLERARTLRCDDAARVWSIPCFFVKAGYRGRGVAGAMLEEALRAMRRHGAKIVEGYPSKPGADGTYIAAFSWTGTQRLFAAHGFEPVGNTQGGKVRVRKALR